jgi:hypothetical protein
MGNEAFNVSGNLLQRLWGKVKKLENTPSYSTICYTLDDTSGTISPTLLFDTSNGEHVVTFSPLTGNQYYIQVTNVNNFSVMVSGCQDTATDNPYNATAYIDFGGSFINLYVQDTTGIAVQNWKRLNLWIFVN